MSVLHQNSGGIGKSIPSALEIYWDPRDFTYTQLPNATEHPVVQIDAQLFFHLFVSNFPQFCTHCSFCIARSALGVVFSINQFLHSICFTFFLSFFFIFPIISPQFCTHCTQHIRALCSGCSSWALGAVFNRFLHSTCFTFVLNLFLHFPLVYFLLNFVHIVQYISEPCGWGCSSPGR